MSKADEMFQELGYEKNETEYAITYNLGKNIIKFWKWAMNIQIITENKIVNLKELQAINEKVKELGWNENI